MGTGASFASGIRAGMASRSDNSSLSLKFPTSRRGSGGRSSSRGVNPLDRSEAIRRQDRMRKEDQDRDYEVRRDEKMRYKDDLALKDRGMRVRERDADRLDNESFDRRINENIDRNHKSVADADARFKAEGQDLRKKAYDDLVGGFYSQDPRMMRKAFAQMMPGYDPADDISVKDEKGKELNKKNIPGNLDFEFYGGPGDQFMGVKFPGKDEYVPFSEEMGFKFLAGMNPNREKSLEERTKHAQAMELQDKKGQGKGTKGGITAKDIADYRQEAIKQYNETFTSLNGGLVEDAPDMEAYINDYMAKIISSPQGMAGKGEGGNATNEPVRPAGYPENAVLRTKKDGTQVWTVEQDGKIFEISENAGGSPTTGAAPDQSTVSAMGGRGDVATNKPMQRQHGPGRMTTPGNDDLLEYEPEQPPGPVSEAVGAMSAGVGKAVSSAARDVGRGLGFGGDIVKEVATALGVGPENWKALATDAADAAGFTLDELYSKPYAEIKKLLIDYVAWQDEARRESMPAYAMQR